MPRETQPTAIPLPRVRQRPHVSGGNFNRQGNLIRKRPRPDWCAPAPLTIGPLHPICCNTSRRVATWLQWHCVHCVATMLPCVARPCLADRLVAPDLSLCELRHMVVPERRESAGGAKAKKGTVLQRRNTAGDVATQQHPLPAGTAGQNRYGLLSARAPTGAQHSRAERTAGTGASCRSTESHLAWYPT